MHIKDGQVQSGFENAVAKFADNYKIPSDPLILIDRENQSIVIVFTDRKFSMWDLQDLTTAEANSRRPSIKRAPTGRHNSILGGLMKANVSIETDGSYLFNPHSSLKLDRKFPPTLSKLSSLSYSKHPYFSSNCMWICSKSASIALVQVSLPLSTSIA